MPQKLRCAVIGAGGIARSHINGFRKHASAEVVAIAELSPERRQEAMTTFEIPRGVENYKELLEDKSIDIVSIALPNFLHAQVAVEAINAGKHVLLEKPMATHASEAQKILDALKKKKVVFMVGQNWRFEKEPQIVKDYVTRGELGDVYHARAWWLRPSGIPRIGSWFTQKKFGGGGCGYDIGVHMLDCTLHLMGCFDAVAVSGLAYAKFGPRGLGGGGWGKGEIDPSKPFDVEDYAGALIKLKNGSSVMLEVSWAMQADPSVGYGISLFGTEAGAQINPVKIIRIREGRNEVATPTYQKLALPEERMVHFMDCVVNGTEPVVKPEQSFKVQRILDAIYESASSGKEVRLDG